MSTIDRAMNKLTGEVVDVEDDGQDSTLQSAPAAAALDPAPAPASGLHDDASGSVDQAVRVAPSAAPGGSGTGGGKARRTSQFLELDLERLAASGMIVPGRDGDATAEEFQHVKRRLLGNIADGNASSEPPANLIMVTSSVPAEGKTYTSVNLAISIAMELDRTVLAVDTDVIKGDMTRVFGATGRPGLFDYLSTDEYELADLLLATSIPKLTLLPAGTVRRNVSEKLASEAMHRLTLELSRRYPDRIVVFDSPPVLATTGATALAPYIGQVVMVVEAGRTTQETLMHALQTMEHARIVGVVLNKTREYRPGQPYYYGYGYGYSYGYGYGYGKDKKAG